MKRLTAILFAALCVAAAVSACSDGKGPARKVSIQELEAGFQNPPKESRVRVWWHWMGDDVTESGIRADFDWFKRVGIAGFHQFNLGGSQGDAKYMSDVWKDRLYFAARLADSLDLEMGVPSCAGFSATAGPWVKPEEGMKKLVWRTVEVRGGDVDVQLPPSFTKVGAFQNGAPAGRSFDPNAPETGGEIAVLAVKLPQGAASPLDAKVTASGGDFTLAMLTDNDVTNGAILPPGREGFAWIQYEFPEAVTVRSLSVVGLAGGGGFPGMGGGGPAANALECSQDGQTWTRVCDVRGGSSQSTMSVPETTAKYFRLTVRNPQPRPMGGMNFGGMAGMGAVGGGRPAQAAPAGTKISEFVVWPTSRINRAEDKAGFTAANNLMDSAT
ncbi:MAG: glycosyl hydrolase, partial [Bacteroidales bacterium]|nr:glycosyl hydrolase [Bacteroidales bacterium]